MFNVLGDAVQIVKSLKGKQVKRATEGAEFMGEDNARKPLKHGFTEKTIVDGWANKYDSLKICLGALNSLQGSAAMSIYHSCRQLDSLT